ncbi:MAG: thymidine kinase [Elusimicrobia bacterium]|nr:thymidine kinase [Elusimicrobiota bacterium]
MIHTILSTGSIEVICGSMFSGKTQELIRRLRLATIARQRVQVFNSVLDKRYGRNHIISHDQAKIPSQDTHHAKDILKLVRPETQVVGIDEVHFFGPEVVEVCRNLADQGKRVIAAGLDQDYRGQPFEVVARLMAIAEFVTKNLAICVVCGNPANRTQRLTSSKRRIEVGAAGKYEARCRRCFHGSL